MSPRRSPPKRGGRRSSPSGGDQSDQSGFCVIGTDWLEWQATHNYAHGTLVDHSFYLARFVAWAELRGIVRPADVTLPVLEAYQRHVSLRRKSDGTPLAWSTQARCLVRVAGLLLVVCEEPPHPVQPGCGSGHAQAQPLFALVHLHPRRGRDGPCRSPTPPPRSGCATGWSWRSSTPPACAGARWWASTSSTSTWPGAG